MTIAASLLPELEQEMATTRRVLERVPEDRLDWSPHEKSWSHRELATHLATIPSWGVLTVEENELDLDAPGAPQPPKPFQSRQGMLEEFDRSVAALRSAITSASDETMMATWTLKKGGEVIFTMPRVGVLRSMVFNHAIHHRAQLAVYLRLCDIPVPAIYGPSADEESP